MNDSSFGNDKSNYRMFESKSNRCLQGDLKWKLRSLLDCFQTSY